MNNTQQWLDHAEAHRREKGSRELKNAHFRDGIEGEVIVDYAEPLAQAMLALSHLSEGIAGRQLERSLAAVVALERSVEALKEWMRLSGYLEPTS